MPCLEIPMVSQLIIEEVFMLLTELAALFELYSFAISIARPVTFSLILRKLAISVAKLVHLEHFRLLIRVRFVIHAPLVNMQIILGVLLV